MPLPPAGVDVTGVMATPRVRTSAAVDKARVRAGWLTVMSIVPSVPPMRAMHAMGTRIAALTTAIRSPG